MADAIRLPKDRADQLRKFAGTNDITISAALGKLMQLAREQGLVENGIPSVEINSFDDGLAIKFDEGETIGLSFATAQRLSDEICRCMRGDNGGTKIVHLCKSHGGSFSVNGRGNAIAVSIPLSAAPKMFTRDLASEFANLLEHEIANAP